MLTFHCRLPQILLAWIKLNGKYISS